MSYCIGVNRVGVDANGYEYSGNSIAIDYLGNEFTEVAKIKKELSMQHLIKRK